MSLRVPVYTQYRHLKQAVQPADLTNPFQRDIRYFRNSFEREFFFQHPQNDCRFSLFTTTGKTLFKAILTDGFFKILLIPFKIHHIDNLLLMLL